MLNLVLRIRRSGGWADFQVTLPEDAYLLDGLETAARQDPTLLFRHACHHASCGSCGLRVNGRERLACITPVKELAETGAPIRLEPLRNFTVLGDLLVDLGSLYRALDRVDLPPIRSDPVRNPPILPSGEMTEDLRFEDCIECGLCVSACPIAATDPEFLGPAGLAACARLVAEPRGRPLQQIPRLADWAHGLWRCHQALECSQVCPSHVDPASAILRLRRAIIFHPGEFRKPS